MCWECGGTICLLKFGQEKKGGNIYELRQKYTGKISIASLLHSPPTELTQTVRLTGTMGEKSEKND